MKQKNAFTLIELIISIIISSIIFFIIFTFIVDSLNEIDYSNSRTELVNEVFSFRDKLNRFIKWGYINMSEVWNSDFNTLMLKDLYSQEWVLFWVVDKDTYKLKKDYLYWNNVIWYRLLSGTEIASIEADNQEIYNLSFFPDKLYNSLIVRDFDVDFFNSWAILDLDFSLMYFLNDSYIWESFTWVVIKPEDIIKFNLNF